MGSLENRLLVVLLPRPHGQRQSASRQVAIQCYDCSPEWDTSSHFDRSQDASSRWIVATLMIIDALGPHLHGVRKRWGGTEYNADGIRFLMAIQFLTGLIIIGLVVFVRLVHKRN